MIALMHFRPEEFVCPCCKLGGVDRKLIRGLETLRILCGNVPLIVLSGYRCIQHNKDIGGSPKSYHITGMAADIKCPPSMTLKEFYDKAENTAMFREGGIGVYPSGKGQLEDFLHLDIRINKARWSRINGVYVGVSEAFV